MIPKSYFAREGRTLPSNRLRDISKLYFLLDALERKVGQRRLSDCSGRLKWPVRGIYFFFEAGEHRSDSGNGPRIVRVGTHALTDTSKTTLWNRLSQHRGQEKSGGGNHRGSIFRLVVGTAVLAEKDVKLASWGDGNNASAEVRKREHAMELEVSKRIGQMPFLWLNVDDNYNGPKLRGYIERNSIALLSNYRKVAVDSHSAEWLGHRCDRERVRLSGLWNQNHVNEEYDPAFLTLLEKFIANEDHAK